MILQKDSGEGLDQADGSLRVVQREIEQVLATSPNISELDRSTLESVRDDVCRTSIELLMMLESLPDQSKAARIAEYISSAVMSALIAGAASTYSPEAKAWFDTGKGHNANAQKVKAANAKNRAMWPHIKAEAEDRGRTLADSDELARLIEPGVRLRMNVGSDQRGYSAATLRRQIRFILSEC